jgi:hypothetical protein
MEETPATYRQVAELTDLVLGMYRRVNTMGVQMADVSAMLNDVAIDLDEMGPALDALIAENAALRGEDAAESAAAEAVRTSFNNLASRFQTEPSVPDVNPLPEGEEPATPVADQ